jgi:hypothetical protein
VMGCNLIMFFLRDNATADEFYTCRWGHLGRLLLRDMLPASVDSSYAFPRSDNCSRLVRAARLTVLELGWKLQIRGVELHRISLNPVTQKT